MIEIRPFRLSDMDRCIELGALLHAESRFAFLPFSERRVRGFAHHVLNNMGGRYCAYVAEDNEDIFGFIVAELQEYWFCDEKVTSDKLFFVDQSHRGSRAAVLLLKAYHAWALSTPAREMTQTIGSAIHPDRTGRFLERYGMEKIGGFYRIRLK